MKAKQDVFTAPSGTSCVSPDLPKDSGGRKHDARGEAVTTAKTSPVQMPVAAQNREKRLRRQRQRVVVAVMFA